MSERPVAAVIAVMWRRDGRRGDEVLLVRRHKPPQAGLWGFPGGKIEFGEPLLRAAERELREETGVHGTARMAFDAVDVIAEGSSEAHGHHYLLVAVLVDWQAGEPVAADDVDEAAWFPVDALPEALSPNVARIVDHSRRLRRRT